MKKHLHKFETTLWLFIRFLLYISLLMVFTRILGRESIGLTRLSRTLGITVTTFLIVWILFQSVYGKYDVGRRKSKPIIYSLVLAVGCTDLVTYLQVMIMRTNTPDIHMFRLYSLGLLAVAFVVQVLVIIIFTYFGNWLFFKIHKPEKCCVVTSSQKSLDEIVFAIQKFKKQYEITKVFDYRDPGIKEYIKKMDSVFMYNIPADIRTDIMRWS